MQYRDVTQQCIITVLRSTHDRSITYGLLRNLHFARKRNPHAATCGHMRPHAHPLLGIVVVQTDKCGYRKYVMQIHHGTLEIIGEDQAG
jgi:hypothetical protein